MLNSQQIIDEGLLKLEHTKGKPAQVGYDLSLKVFPVNPKLGTPKKFVCAVKPIVVIPE